MGLGEQLCCCLKLELPIIGRNGRYNDDMIAVTGNAANAIYRNAVLAVIPKGITDAAYKAAQELITGDLSDQTKLVSRRKSY